MARILTESEIYQTLKKANRNAGFVLKNYPVSRDLSNDGFIRVFKKIFPDTKYSFETIVRARRFVQNTKGLFIKRGKRVEWSEAIKQLNDEGFTVQENLFERA